MILTLDFETHPITDTERYPEPVGAAVQIDNRAPQYRCWGHRPGGNNTDRTAARNWLYDLVSSAERVLMFNAGFDSRVYERLTGVRFPRHKVEDVQILAFLAEPYADRLDLKSVAHRALGLAPEEQTDLFEWIKGNVPEAKGKRTKLGRYIAYAPGGLVAPYAKGDVSRTYKLWQYWRALRHSSAYTEIELPMLSVVDDMEREGLPLDHDGLASAYPSWCAARAKAAHYLLRMLGGDIDLGKHEQVADRLEKLDLVREWIETARGKRSLAYDSLAVLVAEGKFDGRFAEAWGYYSVINHTLGTFAEPWLEAGRTLHPQWNATRQERGGARTGRLSSNPNVQNIIKVPPSFAVPRSWLPLPRMRQYVRAPRGQRLVGADISQQELRVLAHAVGEPLVGWYRADPGLDLHVKVSELIAQITGLRLERGIVKTINFAKIYGAGVARLASQLKRTEADARLFKDAHTQALPGVRRWEKKLAAKTRFITAGGREYHHDPERPYKSPNTYIQGSSADQSKRVMLAVQPEVKKLDGSLCSMAHDEFVARVPVSNARRVRDLMLDVIASTGYGGSRQMFEVPFRGEAYIRGRWQE